MRDRMIRGLRRAMGDDEYPNMWDRLTPDGRAVIRLAFAGARESGHPCMADEHVLLGLLHHGSSRAAALLRAEGLDLDTVRAELARVGPTLGPGADPNRALQTLGIDVAQVRRRLEATFGAQALQAAERRCGVGRGGAADIRDPTRCASTFWPSGRSRSPRGTPSTAATRVWGRSTCCMACSRTPRTRSAPN